MEKKKKIKVMEGEKNNSDLEGENKKNKSDEGK